MLKGIMHIEPYHVWLSLIVSSITIVSFLWKISASMSNLNLKVTMLWNWFEKEHNINSNSSTDVIKKDKNL